MSTHYLKKKLKLYLSPKDLRKSLAERKGQCKGCGECCRNLLNLKIRCPLLSKNNHCSVQKIKKYLPVLRQMCYFTPISPDSRNMEDADKKCGYYWDKPAK